MCIVCVQAIREAAEHDPLMARMQAAWGNPLKELAGKAGVRWVESSPLPLIYYYHIWT